MSSSPARDRRRRIARELTAIYADLPRIDCQKRCAQACGPIAMSRGEFERIAARSEVSSPDDFWRPELSCPLLDGAVCSVYVVRPLICRLWGLVPSMRCHFGCEPERWLTDAQAAQFMRRVEAVAGVPAGVTD